MSNLLRVFPFLSLLPAQILAQYAAVPRWGQASVLVRDLLFVYGGKTDQYNQYSYTSAPNNNDLLKLSLSDPFNLSSPPWEYLGGSSNSSTTQGPTVAWSSLSAYNTSQSLLFGGEPGPNAEPVISTLSDSANVLDIYNQHEPQWISEPQSWANEPMRRIYHSASSTGGKIWIIGGEKADGSNSALSDHIVFNPAFPTFSLLPTTNGPPDIYGHQSIVLTNGSLIVLGGYSQSMGSMIPLSTIWMLDTTSSDLKWTMLLVDTSNLPTPRRGFAATLVVGVGVLIHGGSDASVETTYGDGWLLDITRNPMVWTPLPQLSQVGPRRDHLAVALGSSVIFGFGYGSNGPASADLFVYDCSSNSWPPSYVPPPPSGTSSIYTLPPPQTSKNPNTPTYAPGSSTGSSGHSTGSVQPTHTMGGGPGSGEPNGAASKRTAIALGTVFGVLALLAGALLAVYYYKRYQRLHPHPQRFHVLGGTDPEESPHEVGELPVAANVGQRATMFGFSGRNGTHYRRDMLADEDTRYFDTPRRTPSGGSSFHSFTRPEMPSFTMGSSLASLRSVGAMLGMGGVGARRSREPSRSSRASSWEEKFDPFSDQAALVPTERPKGGGWSLPTYSDPFSDKEIGEYHDDDSDAHSINMEATLNEHPDHYLETPIPTSRLRALAPLSPIVETSSHQSSGLHSSDSDHHLYGIAVTSSNSSDETPKSPPRRSSILDANTPPSQPMRRSDTWWSRFSRTSFLDRRSSDGGASSSRQIEFRDPNPAPRLGAIEEGAGNRSESSGNLSLNHTPIYSTVAHGRSVSSMRTAQTADSEVLERIGGMDIVQRDTTIGSRYSDDQALRGVPPGRHVMPADQSDENDLSVDRGGISRPFEGNLAEPAPVVTAFQSSGKPTGGRPMPPRRLTSGGLVSSRVEAFEQRKNLDATGSLPSSPDDRSAKNNEVRIGKDRDRTGVKYGFAPKPSLFVANPDRKSPSATS